VDPLPLRVEAVEPDGEEVAMSADSEREGVVEVALFEPLVVQSCFKDVELETAMWFGVMRTNSPCTSWRWRMCSAKSPW
jgi:hypothetical protein